MSTPTSEADLSLDAVLLGAIAAVQQRSLATVSAQVKVAKPPPKRYFLELATHD